MFGAVLCCSAQPVVSGITNAADYTGRISPGSIATLFGSNFTAAPAAGATTIPLPPSINGVTVAINGTPCPLFYVGAAQINFQVPYEIPSGSATITVAADSGSTSAIPFAISAAAPGIFQYGTNRAVAVNYPSPLNSDTAPVSVGQELIVYFTGIGPTTNPPGDGATNSTTTLSPATSTFSASVGGVDAPVMFLGLAPGFVGLAQANIMVPFLYSGDYPLTITVNNAVSASSLVTVGGNGTAEPGVLTYLATAPIPAPSFQTLSYTPTTVQVNGTYAYVCGPDQITVIDVSNPQSPVSAGSFGTPAPNGVGTPCIISQNYLVTIVNASELSVYDLRTSATNPQLLAGPIGLQITNASALVFDGSTAVFGSNLVTWSLSNDLITSEFGSVETYNFSNFAAPAYGATFNPPSGYTDDTAPRYGLADLGNGYVAVAGTTNNGILDGGAATSGQGEITVINVSNPANPAPAVQFLLPPATVVAYDIAVQGTTALITGNTQDWSNPVPQISINEFEILSQGSLTLDLVDFTNPAAPVLLNNFNNVTAIPASQICHAVSLGGNFFAIVIPPPVTDFTGASTLALVDARNHLTYQLDVIPIATVYGLSGMAVSGNYLVVSTAQGLSIYQIALPTS